LAFYTDGKILNRVPLIKGMVDSVSLSESGFKDIERSELDSERMEEAKALLQAILRDRSSWKGRGSHIKLVLLSGSNDDDTVRLPREIVNNKKDHRGRPTAFTQSQRYVSLAKLRVATVTSDLE
jgi:hypothetical protein